jgi:hypothetical protein
MNECSTVGRTPCMEISQCQGHCLYTGQHKQTFLSLVGPELVLQVFFSPFGSRGKRYLPSKRHAPSQLHGISWEPEVLRLRHVVALGILWIPVLRQNSAHVLENRKATKDCARGMPLDVSCLAYSCPINMDLLLCSEKSGGVPNCTMFQLRRQFSMYLLLWEFERTSGGPVIEIRPF